MIQSKSFTVAIKWLSISASLVCLLLWTYSHVAQSIYTSLNFDGFIANGPFQLFNPLRRIAAGQTGGVDFQFFHGLGVPYLHYPIFALFGKNLFASELTRNLTSLFCFLFSLIIFSFVLTEKNLKHTLFCTVGVICLLEFLSFKRMDSYGLALATPGNSLLGVRSTFPILAFAVLLSNLQLRLKAALLGAMFAAALFFGTEHGLALISSFIAITCLSIFISFLGNKKLSSIRPLFLNRSFYLISIISFLLFLVLIFGAVSKFAGIKQTLRYNIVEVPADQFWYFGAPPNDYAWSLLDFADLYWQGLAILLGAVFWFAGLIFQAFKSKHQSWSNIDFTVQHMLCYGLISCASCLGMLESGYLAPLIRIFVLTVFVYIFKKNLFGELSNYFGSVNWRASQIAKPAGALILSLFLLPVIYISINRTSSIPYKFGETPVAHLSISWVKHMAQATQALQDKYSNLGSLKIWSTYSGLLEDNLHYFHPREDYIIHALGKTRRDLYLSTFQSIRPDVVQTIRRSYFLTYTQNHDYEQWLRNTSWGFYEDLLDNYDILTATDRSLFWKRKNGDWVQPNNNFRIVSGPTNNGQITIPLPEKISKNSLVVVKLKYQINNPWRKLPVFGGLPRYLITLENSPSALPISLSPSEQEIHFPVMLLPGCRPTLYFETRSLLPGASYKIDEVAYKLLELTDEQGLFLKD